MKHPVFTKIKDEARTIILIAVAMALPLGVYSKVSSDDANRRAEDASRRDKDLCFANQRVYDGQFKYTEFLAKQFHATPKQTADGLEALRQVLGPRPVC